ncbi:hypothetical protein C0991_005108 [Blastosporella zonata]|nr:hypothetical protein C0991_005108 [Blastosporella zonata]
MAEPPSAPNLSRETIDKVEPQSQDDVDIYQVAFDPADPSNPKNWSRLRRWYLTMASGLLVLNASDHIRRSYFVITDIGSLQNVCQLLTYVSNAGAHSG